MRYTIAAFVALFALTAHAENEIRGKAFPLDGDTIIVTPDGGNPVKIRLWAVDAPEMKVWPWGPMALYYIDRFLEIFGPDVVCSPKGKSHDRIVASCVSAKAPGGVAADMGGFLISTGFAVEYRSFGGGAYAIEERSAREKRHGVWNNIIAKK